MNVPAQLPIFPLGNVLYQGGLMPLHIFEERYRRLIPYRLHDEPTILPRRLDRVDPRP